MTAAPELQLPEHVALIMDGNGRWAKARGKDRLEGHAAGVQSVITAVDFALEKGVSYLTLYAFSTENWSRPSEEVQGLMQLFLTVIKEQAESLNQQGVCVRFIGDKGALDDELCDTMSWIETETKTNQKLTLIIALNYGSRDEVLRATRKMLTALNADEISTNTIDDKLFSSFLDTADFPDPDLLIRTSGELRLSNFLLWQLAYAEIYITDTLWPDFGKDEFALALANFAKRKRRFGGI